MNKGVKATFIILCGAFGFIFWNELVAYPSELAVGNMAAQNNYVPSSLELQYVLSSVGNVGWIALGAYGALKFDSYFSPHEQIGSKSERRNNKKEVN